MLIGQELDHEAAREQLESCLLTAKEMACGEESWLALADPWKAAKQGGVDGVHYPHDEHGPLSGVTEASLREMMKRASKQGMPTDYLLGDVFEMFFDHDAADQIRACAPALRELLDGSEDTRRARQVILEGVVSLVTSPMLKKASCLVAEAMGAAPKPGEAMLKKTPAILMALYDIDVLDKAAVVDWRTDWCAPGKKVGAHVTKVREAAEPFIQWLRQEPSLQERYKSEAL